ncbi:MFS transporter [Rugosimonospora africana]|uniref:MFS transporter n=1 Tax=Rugosimonospora africana TaxID=556532 RepID=A0A8J3R4G2_9ACTN|nr:MFS transporter [Rugosimonospora africana]
MLLDATIVNVALPAISASIGGSLSVEQWTLNAYTLTFAACMLTAGSLGDRWGARRCFLGGLALFGAASAVCAASPTTSVLIAARALQGGGAAALVPCSLALIAHRFPDGPARDRALGAWGGISGAGLASGPILGGFLVGSLGWRTIFLIGVPVAAASALLVVVTVDETPRRAARRTDLPGQLLAVAALAALSAALTETSTHGWADWQPIALGLSGIACAIAFVRTERTRHEPMLPLGIFTARRFSAATGIGALFNFGLYGTLFCLSIYLEDTLHHSTRNTGLLILPLTVVIACCALLSGRLSARTGPRLPMIVGLGGGVAGASLFATVGATTPIWLIATCGAVFGVIGLAMPAMTSVALGSAPPSYGGLSAAVLNAARQTGGVLGVALLGSVLHTSTGVPDLRLAMTVVAASYLLAALIAARLRTTRP